MDYDFVSNSSTLEIGKSRHNTYCKVCQKAMTNDDDNVKFTTYFNNSRVFHICFDCWRKINKLVEEYENE